MIDWSKVVQVIFLLLGAIVVAYLIGRAIAGGLLDGWRSYFNQDWNYCSGCNRYTTIYERDTKDGEVVYLCSSCLKQKEDGHGS